MKKISSENRKLLRCLVRSSHFVKSFYGSRSNPIHKFPSSEAFEPTNQSNCVFSLTKTFTAQNHTCIHYSRESYFKCLSAQSHTSNVLQPRVRLRMYTAQSHTSILLQPGVTLLPFYSPNHTFNFVQPRIIPSIFYSPVLGAVRNPLTFYYICPCQLCHYPLAERNISKLY